MTHVTKLTLAVVLGLLAAALNAMWLAAQKRPAMFVTAGADIEAGQVISEELLATVPVPGDIDQLRASLIPYDDRAILFGRKASRDYARGDIIFQRDIEAPSERIRYEYLGPFRVVSVSEGKSGQEEIQVSSGGGSITIAVSQDPDQRTIRLLSLIDPHRKPESGGKRGYIVSVQVIPKDQQSPTASAEPRDVAYQTVSLQGIENAPATLLEGDNIRFVISPTNPQ